MPEDSTNSDSAPPVPPPVPRRPLTAPSSYLLAWRSIQPLTPQPVPGSRRLSDFHADHMTDLDRDLLILEQDEREFAFDGGDR